MNAIFIRKASNRTLFEKLSFVVKSRKKLDIFRPHLMYAHVFEGVAGDRTAVATDGYRIHWANDIDVPDGGYEVKSLTKTQIILMQGTVTLRGASSSAFQTQMHIPTEDSKFVELDWAAPGISLHTLYLNNPESLPINLNYFTGLAPCSLITPDEGGKSYYATNESLKIHARVMASYKS